MTPLAIALGVAVVNVAVLAWLFWRRTVRLEADKAALSEHGLGLAYIATGHTYPYEQRFAAALAQGNQATLRRHFPGYATWRAAELERREAAL